MLTFQYGMTHKNITAIVMVTLDLPDTIKQIVMTLGRLGFDEAAAENRRKWQRLC